MALELSDTLLELLGIGTAEAADDGVSTQTKAGFKKSGLSSTGDYPQGTPGHLAEPPGWTSSGQWNFTGADAKYQARAAARLHVGQNLDQFKLGRPNPSDPKWNTKFEQTVSDLAKQYMEKARETK